MANSLDELTGPVNPEGRDINVIHKQLPVEVGFGTTLFQIGVWLAVPLIGTIIALAVPDLEPKWAYILGACGIGVVCGLILQYMKTKAQNYFQQLEQKIQAEASNIDNYMEQRVVILENLVGLVNRAINLDKDVMESVAALRSGIVKGGDRNEIATRTDATFRGLAFQMEAYPDLKAHQAIADAIQQNSYLQKEITAARTVYNNRVYQWNRDIYDWPVKQMVAAKEGYTTRIPFTTTSEYKERSRAKFF